MIRPDRRRRIVFYVGPWDTFRDYVHGEVERLLGMDGNPVFAVTRALGGRSYSIERGRRFEYLGTGVGDITRNMRGLSASAVDVVYGVDHRCRDERRAEIEAFARYVTVGATPAEREREQHLDLAMRETGEPYEILVDLIEAMDAMADEVALVERHEGGES